MSDQLPAAETGQGKALKPIDDVRTTLEKLKPQFAAALPRHLTVDRLLRVAMTAVQNTPKLLECDRKSLFSAVMTCATLGLEPDGVLGQAYLVPFGGKVQFIPGYKGLITLARNSGDVMSIMAQAVYEHDQFEYEFGLVEKLTHKPSQESDRGEITHFYAVANFKDGGKHWDVMTRAEVEKIRDGSQGYKSAQKFGKGAESPWVKNFDEMGKKTAIRRIAKYLPMSVQKAAALSDAYESGRHAHIDNAGELVIEGTASVVGADPKKIGKTKLDQFEDEKPEAAQESHDPETGEIMEPDDSRTALEQLIAEFKQQASAKARTAWLVDNRERIEEIIETRGDLAKEWLAMIDASNKGAQQTTQGTMV